ncbi:MAG: phosphopyruvate hydratase [Candidatus Woykebacteria bacterium RBG_19FT_COMBO_43_10]|uniref:Enolase n=1 Tax=Candidatus Woykebacteria bacterium RBG_19FT_COMBO_43_10 TaxID=1802598 RepID=A0A1G1WJI3_9BACT|nr:MAG: phosphopyruvate hydratase [Candidatus Woykebacteria bacterium RBG_19FT_COMBO_43_10]
MSKISSVTSEEILDSNGTPTLRTHVYLDDGSVGTASVPSGASRGSNEVAELRDLDPGRFNGMGVLRAAAHVQNLIYTAVKNTDPFDQEKIDETMRSLDGTVDKSRLGGNAILSVSLAVAKAAASSLKLPLFKYVRRLGKVGSEDFQIPLLMINLIEGGKHVKAGLDFQEFLVIPKGQKSIEVGHAKIYKLIESLQILIGKEKIGSGLGMEGGFSVKLSKNEEAINLLKEAVDHSEFTDEDFAVGLDIAAMSIYENGKYHLSDIQKPLDPGDFIDYLEKISKKYALYSLEDPLNENDWNGWKKLKSKLSLNTLVIGDDLTTTNQNRLTQALDVEAVSGVVVKPNQIGTLSETLAFALRAKEAGTKIVVSHRGGETKDTFIADLAVGLNADLIKIGSPLQTERLVKFNRLMEIEQELRKETI